MRCTLATTMDVLKKDRAMVALQPRQQAMLLCGVGIRNGCAAALEVLALQSCWRQRDIVYRMLGWGDTDLLHFGARVLRGERQLLLLGVHFPVPEPCCVSRPRTCQSQTVQAGIRGVRQGPCMRVQNAGEKRQRSRRTVFFVGFVVYCKGRQGHFSVAVDVYCKGFGGGSPTGSKNVSGTSHL
jgi:hypothetical protein